MFDEPVHWTPTELCVKVSRALYMDKTTYFTDLEIAEIRRTVRYNAFITNFDKILIALKLE